MEILRVKQVRPENAVKLIMYETDRKVGRVSMQYLQ